MRAHGLALAVVSAIVLLGVAPGAASDSAFTYQGHLTNDGALTNGDRAMVFRLCTAPTGGTALGTRGALAILFVWKTSGGRSRPPLNVDSW